MNTSVIARSVAMWQSRKNSRLLWREWGVENAYNVVFVIVSIFIQCRLSSSGFVITINQRSPLYKFIFKNIFISTGITILTTTQDEHRHQHGKHDQHHQNDRQSRRLQRFHDRVCLCVRWATATSTRWRYPGIALSVRF